MAHMLRSNLVIALGGKDDEECLQVKISIDRSIDVANTSKEQAEDVPLVPGGVGVGVQPNPPDQELYEISDDPSKETIDEFTRDNISSTQRWKLLQTHFTIKSLSTTRWSARADACKTLRKSWNEIHKVLVTIENDTQQNRYMRSKSNIRGISIGDGIVIETIAGMLSEPTPTAVLKSRRRRFFYSSSTKPSRIRYVERIAADKIDGEKKRTDRRIPRQTQFHSFSRKPFGCTRVPCSI
ncbi:hypothetical protein EVAR_59498_1 [Eumeta japonica]|uniref:Uncharacterized protein n=1 Tax=Eumeta variegata TaxID=151549 RepID=A0A4C1YGX3_EUMVA|nr:hypothetical protein EVAR_59498_1 [Eumeta japonica]